MKPFIVLFIIITHFQLFAQSKKFIKYNRDYDSLEIINKVKLDSILTNSEASLNFVAIFTNGCSGTRYMLNTLQKYSKGYDNKLNIILANSDSYTNIPYFKKLLNKYELQLPKAYIIDSEVYKDKRSDSRMKGYKFRNDICSECRPDIIGVPYYILYGKNKELLYHGYASLDSLLKNSLKGK